VQFPDTLTHWLLVAASAAAVGFFAAGLTLYFERAPRPLWVLAVHYLSMAVALGSFLGVLFLPTRSDPWVGAAIAMYVTSIAIFLAAIESAKRTRLQRSFVDHPLPDRLITDGPYKWVRHPFCLGYLLGALAGPIGIDHPLMFVFAAPLAVIAVAAAVREEQVWLSGPRADEYREYRRLTGMFIPFVGRGQATR
jgi:protein-S-isoprenylcysteine O-methyltransferase Ste14